MPPAGKTAAFPDLTLSSPVHPRVPPSSPVSLQGELQVRTVYIPPADTAPAGKPFYFEVCAHTLTHSVGHTQAHSIGLPVTSVPVIPLPQLRTLQNETGKTLCLCASSAEELGEVVRAVETAVGPRAPSAPQLVKPQPTGVCPRVQRGETHRGRVVLLRVCAGAYVYIFIHTLTRSKSWGHSIHAHSHTHTHSRAVVRVGYSRMTAFPRLSLQAVLPRRASRRARW